jgi:hypothetical protein
MTCPKCHSNDVVYLWKRNALYPLALVSVLGWLALLHQPGSKSECYCRACHTRVGARSSVARFAMVLFWVCFGVVAIVLALLILAALANIFLRR